MKKKMSLQDKAEAALKKRYVMLWSGIKTQAVHLLYGRMVKPFVFLQIRLDKIIDYSTGHQWDPSNYYLIHR